jgi:hypothetical protein
VSCCGPRARSRHQDLKIDIRFDLKEIDIPIEKKDFRVISCEIGRLSTGRMDAINPTIGTEGRLHLYLAVVTMSAGDTPAPKDFVPYFKGVSVNTLLLSIHLHDLSRSFVAEDHGKPDARISPLPHMDIGATNARSLNSYKNLTLPWTWDRETPQDQRLIEFLQYDGSGFSLHFFANSILFPVSAER